MNGIKTISVAIEHPKGHVLVNLSGDNLVLLEGTKEITVPIGPLTQVMKMFAKERK